MSKGFRSPSSQIEVGRNAPSESAIGMSQVKETKEFIKTEVRMEEDPGRGEGSVEGGTTVLSNFWEIPSATGVLWQPVRICVFGMATGGGDPLSDPLRNEAQGASSHRVANAQGGGGGVVEGSTNVWTMRLDRHMREKMVQRLRLRFI